MADIDHPKTHVEDQDLDEPRKQPKSPRHEGIDPLTESDTMYPASNTKSDSEKLARKEEKAATESDKDTTVEDQEERNAVANTPNKVLNDDAPKSKSTGSTASSR